MKPAIFLLGVCGLLGCGGSDDGAQDDAAPTDDAGVASDASTTDAPPDAPCGGRWSTSDDPRFAQVLDALEAWLAERSIPGGVAAVIDGDTIVTGGVGVKSAGTCDAIGASTRFRIGLVQESVTAAAVLHAETAGALDINAPIAPAGFALHHLMTHSSGIGPGSPACASLEDYFAVPSPMWSQPGEVFWWAGRHMARAGLALSQATGVSFDQAVRDHVTTPLGMTSFTFEPTEAEAGDHADGHFPLGTGLRVQHISVNDCDWNKPSYQAFATIGDVARFAAMLIHDGDVAGLLTPAQVARMTNGTSLHDRAHFTTGYGMNVSTVTSTGGATVGYATQGGTSSGHTQILVVIPERDFAVVVMANFGELPDPVPVAIAAIHAFEPDLNTDPFPREPPLPATFPDYAGVYRDDVGGRTLTITHDAVAMTLTADSDGVSAPLVPWNIDRFEMTLSGTRYLPRFWRNTNGTPAIITVSGPAYYRVSP